MAFVAVVLAVVVLVTRAPALEWLGAVAVLLGFGHATVSERLAEREAARQRPSVPCHAMAKRYFVAKEIAWFAFFAAHGAWSAIAGVVLMLAYPMWRRAWRSRHPMAPIRIPLPTPDFTKDADFEIEPFT